MDENSIVKDGYEVLQEDPFVKELMRPAYGYYAVHFLLAVLGFCLSAAILVLSPLWWVQVLNALFLAFVIVQTATLAHDLAHGQVFCDPELDVPIGSTVWALLCGVSLEHWYAHHNTHHREVNRIGHDPDMDLPFYFDIRELAGVPAWVRRYYVPVQHLLFFPAMGAAYLFLTLRGYWYLVRRPSFRGAYEGALILVHFAILFYFLFTYLAPMTILLFLAVHVMTATVYMGMVFAPNHKGMPVMDKEHSVSWRDQVVSTRNLTPTYRNFIMFGGLNFQIEHHLFPHMPRINYFDVQPLVRELCAREGLSYHETSARRSFGEMYERLREVARAKGA